MAKPHQPKSPPPAFVGTSLLGNGERTINFRAPGPPRMIYKYAGDDALIATMVRWAGRSPGKALKLAKAKLSLYDREMLCPICGSPAREGARYCSGMGHELPPWPAARTPSERSGGALPPGYAVERVGGRWEATSPDGRVLGVDFTTRGAAVAACVADAGRGAPRGGKGRRAKLVATLIHVKPSKRGRMAFLSLSRPVAYRETYDGAPLEHAEHAVVSESASFDPETHEPIIVETAIFPAHPDGRIASGRMLKQYRNLVDWRKEVARAGWELVEAAGGGKARAATATCPGCGGGGGCAWCAGKGCVQCAGTGLCGYCGGVGARRRGGKVRYRVHYDAKHTGEPHVQEASSKWHAQQWARILREGGHHVRAVQPATRVDALADAVKKLTR